MMNSQCCSISKWLGGWLAISLWLVFVTLSMAQAPAPTGAPGVYPYPSGPGPANVGGPTGSAGSYGSYAGGGYTPGQYFFDQPTAMQPMPDPLKAGPRSTCPRILEAICWYLPNRVMDLSDVIRFHFSMGDGMGISLRATKYLCGSWFQDSAFCLGWTKRTPPWFGEQIEEQFFGFLAASEGELDRDPTEVGLSAHFLILGFNVAASGGEILDGLLGFAGVDLMGDDHGPMMYDKIKIDPADRANQVKVHGKGNALSTSKQESPARAKSWSEKRQAAPEKPFKDPGKEIDQTPQNGK